MKNRNVFQRVAIAAITAGFAVARKIPFLRQAVNRYEAAFQGWGERSWLFGTLQDAWLEIDSMTRQELQRIHEQLIENSPIVQKIRSLKIQFSVGPAGLKVIPESSDEGFNDARSANWENWWAAPELGSSISGAQLTRVWSGLLFDKGEIFIYKTNAKVPVPRGAQRLEPRLQTIDAHRVKTPGGMTEDRKTGYPIIDGIVVNPQTGERIAYYVRRANYSTFISGTANTAEEVYDRLLAENVIHVFKMRRPGQMRGIPEGVSAYNLVRDNMDLHKLEMQAAKLASEIATVETNRSGELSTYTSRKQKLNIQTQNAAGAAVTKNSFADYNVTVGAKKIAMQHGDKLEQFMISRPTVAAQNYWDLHYTLICMGYEVPKLLAMPYNLQGTVTRADLDVCANAFRVEFELIRETLEAVYEWHGDWALKYDTEFTGELWMNLVDRTAKSFLTARPVFDAKNLAANRAGMQGVRAAWLSRQGHAKQSPWVMDGATPPDAHQCLIRPPRAPNVDIGYTAKALEIEMRLGIKCPQDVFADKGQDWRQQVWQMGEFIQYVNEVAKQTGTDPNQITSLIAPPEPDQPDKPPAGEPESSPENHLLREASA